MAAHGLLGGRFGAVVYILVEAQDLLRRGGRDKRSRA
jgi:hypothetical protein